MGVYIQQDSTTRIPLATPTFVWDGGCANHADVQYLDLGYGHTLESCNSECHQLNWCTHINLNNINNLCKVFASGCTNDAGNSAVYKYYKSVEYPTPIWNGGCSNWESLTSDHVSGLTLDSCNTLCKSKPWCTDIVFRTSDSICWNYASGCTQGNSDADLSHYKSSDLNTKSMTVLASSLSE